MYNFNVQRNLPHNILKDTFAVPNKKWVGLPTAAGQAQFFRDTF